MAHLETNSNKSKNSNKTESLQKQKSIELSSMSDSQTPIVSQESSSNDKKGFFDYLVVYDLEEM